MENHLENIFTICIISGILTLANHLSQDEEEEVAPVLLQKKDKSEDAAISFQFLPQDDDDDDEFVEFKFQNSDVRDDEYIRELETEIENLKRSIYEMKTPQKTKQPVVLARGQFPLYSDSSADMTEMFKAYNISTSAPGFSGDFSQLEEYLNTYQNVNFGNFDEDLSQFITLWRSANSTLKRFCNTYTMPAFGVSGAIDPQLGSIKRVYPTHSDLYYLRLAYKQYLAYQQSGVSGIPRNIIGFTLPSPEALGNESYYLLTGAITFSDFSSTGANSILADPTALNLLKSFVAVVINNAFSTLDLQNSCSTLTNYINPRFVASEIQFFKVYATDIYSETGLKPPPLVFDLSQQPAECTDATHANLCAAGFHAGNAGLTLMFRLDFGFESVTGNLQDSSSADSIISSLASQIIQQQLLFENEALPKPFRLEVAQLFSDLSALDSNLELLNQTEYSNLSLSTFTIRRDFSYIGVQKLFMEDNSVQNVRWDKWGEDRFCFENPNLCKTIVAVPKVVRAQTRQVRRLPTETMDSCPMEMKTIISNRENAVMSLTPSTWLKPQNYNFSDNTWTDQYGKTFNGVHSTPSSDVCSLYPNLCQEDSFQLVFESGNGAEFPIYALRGGRNDKINLPLFFMPSILLDPLSQNHAFTVCTLSRYTSTDTTTQNRIWEGENSYFFHGHGKENGNVLAGAVQHSISPTSESPEGKQPLTNPERQISEQATDWFVVCASSSGTIPTNVLVNGNPVGVAPGATFGNVNISINKTFGLESNFEISEILYFDRALEYRELLTVSQYLQSLLGIVSSLYGYYSEYVLARTNVGNCERDDSDIPSPSEDSDSSVQEIEELEDYEYELFDTSPHWTTNGIIPSLRLNLSAEENNSVWISKEQDAELVLTLPTIITCGAISIQGWLNESTEDEFGNGWYCEEMTVSYKLSKDQGGYSASFKLYNTSSSINRLNFPSQLRFQVLRIKIDKFVGIYPALRFGLHVIKHVTPSESNVGESESIENFQTIPFEESYVVGIGYSAQDVVYLVFDPAKQFDLLFPVPYNPYETIGTSSTFVMATYQNNWLYKNNQGTYSSFDNVDNLVIVATMTYHNNYIVSSISLLEGINSTVYGMKSGYESTSDFSVEINPIVNTATMNGAAKINAGNLVIR